MAPLKNIQKFILDKLKKELPKHLSYHSVSHIKDVFNSCKIIAKGEGVKGEDLKLLLTAALFHDSGFVIQQKDHERISCEIAQKHLPDFGYSNQQIEQICGMIMATKIPQTPHNKLEEILADSDLDYLGRDDFFLISNKLFDELSFYGIISTEDEWNRIQIRFLENHHYFTDTAIKLRKAKKDYHLNKIKSMLKH
ncbi:MAG: HD domain-containing protein [Chitinophagaceae bacterium]|nr:HD domain-containing protein [Chitinophagaceae bacterium]MCW5905344.1 HD domain-containing protein [Chitinophagaceae bacterium]